MVRPTASAIVPTTSGPPVEPTSPINRQTPRNSPVARRGARSAPRVIIEPAPIPLPRPMTQVAASSPA